MYHFTLALTYTYSKDVCNTEVTFTQQVFNVSCEFEDRNDFMYVLRNTFVGEIKRLFANDHYSCSAMARFMSFVDLFSLICRSYSQEYDGGFDYHVQDQYNGPVDADDQKAVLYVSVEE